MNNSGTVNQLENASKRIFEDQNSGRGSMAFVFHAVNVN